MPAASQFLGFGLGLRTNYYQEILEQRPAVDWFEIISENYMVEGGKPLYYLDAIGEHYPLVMHGVSLSIGGPHDLDNDYLKRLKALAERVKPQWISDHLCWSRGSAHHLHDLLPLPFTEESLSHVASRVRQVQDVIERPLVLENASTYIRSAGDKFTEWEFLSALSAESGCELLLDVNNVYVSARNHGFDPWEFISSLPADKIRQMHLAGHTDYGTYLIDTHDHPVCDPVWELYERTASHFGPVATMIERDDHFPPFAELMDELEKARSIAARAFAKEPACV